MSESPIFDGILSTSRQKADKLVEKAEAEAKELLAEAQHNAAKAVEEERRQAAVRLEAVRVKEEGAERSFQRLEELKRSDEAYQAVDAALGDAFELYFKGPDARKTLIAWTAEAALGLGLPEAKVASCLATRVDESMLKEAEALLEERCGVKVTLTPSDEAPLPGLGVRLSSLDDKVYYDNRLSVRLVRKSRSVRKIIQECTCKIG